MLDQGVPLIWSAALREPWENKEGLYNTDVATAVCASRQRTSPYEELGKPMVSLNYIVTLAT